MAFAETFKALSDPARRRILELLKNGRLSAGEIGSHFDMTGATISYHLGILKKADLVLEINSEHPIAKKLAEADDEMLAKYIKILYAQAKWIAGLDIDNPTELTDSIVDLM